MKCYLIWAINLPTETDTTDRDMYVERFPNAPQYSPFYLFPANYNEVMSLTCDVVDLSGKALVDVVDDADTQLSFASFDALADQLISDGFSGRCVVLSVQQGKYLHRTRYLPSSPD